MMYATAPVPGTVPAQERIQEPSVYRGHYLVPIRALQAGWTLPSGCLCTACQRERQTRR